MKCSKKASTWSASPSPSFLKAKRAFAPKCLPPTPPNTSTAPSPPSPKSESPWESFDESPGQIAQRTRLVDGRCPPTQNRPQRRADQSAKDRHLRHRHSHLHLGRVESANHSRSDAHRSRIHG